MPESYTFTEFHLIIQAAFGWKNCHLYEFVDTLFRPTYRIVESSHFEFCDERDVLNADETAISDYFKSVGDKCVYTYDFGDCWELDVLLEKIENDGICDPFCITGKGLCPPENCGGVYGYERLKELAKADSFSPEDDIQELVDAAAEILMSGSVCYVDYLNNICQTSKFKNVGPYCARLNPPTKKQFIAFFKTVIQCIPKQESKLRASLALALNSPNPYNGFDEILSVTPYVVDWNNDNERVSSKALEIISKSFESLLSSYNIPDIIACMRSYFTCFVDRLNLYLTQISCYKLNRVS